MKQKPLFIVQKRPKGEDGFRVFSIRLKIELVNQLDEISVQTGHSRNKLIGMFIEFALKNCEV